MIDVILTTLSVIATGAGVLVAMWRLGAERRLHLRR
jgi:hypothetical protein